MQRQSPPNQHLFAKAAIGFIFCISSHATLAAAGGQANSQPGAVAAETRAKNPNRAAVRAKVEEPRIPTKPQRPVMPLKQK